MAKDSYLEISSHFGIYHLEQSIALCGDKFLKKYSSSDGQLFMSADSQTVKHKLLFFFFFFFLFLLLCCIY